MTKHPTKVIRMLRVRPETLSTLDTIPHTLYYPQETYVGINLSKVQTNAGLKYINAMGLKDIAVKHCSITDFDKSFGKFDYIICHGVFS